MRNLRFILAHKDFDDTKFNADYTFDETFVLTQNHNVVSKKYKTVYYEGRPDTIYGELAAWEWIYANYNQFPECWTVLDHYRRNMDIMYGNVTVANSIYFGSNVSMASQMSYYHGDTLVQMLESVLKPNELSIFRTTTILHPYNIFYCNMEELGMWLRYVNEKIEMIERNTGIYDQKSALEFVKNNPEFTKQMNGKNTDILYQSRIYAFILERLNTLYWLQRSNFYLGKVYLLEEGRTI